MFVSDVKQDMNYTHLVLNLLKNKHYPVLWDHVILDIYYKKLKPKCAGKQYISCCPEVVFEQENEATKIVYLTHHDKYIYVHKENPKDIELKNLAVQCIKVKINKGYINKILKTDCKSFEEEIYKFLTELNFNVPKVREVLNLSFVDSTRFVPDSIQMWISRYHSKPIQNQCLSRDYFGPSNDLIDSRMIFGKLSTCTSNDKILSLRNSRAMENDEENEELIPLLMRQYERYTYHYLTEYQTYIPLAYNPLENPIISL